MESKPPDPPGGLTSDGKLNFDINCQNSNLPLKRKFRPRDHVELTPPKPNLSFLLVKREDGKPMSDLSPFLIDKLLTSSCGAVKSAKKLKEGSLLVETHSTEQGQKLIRNLPQNMHIKLSVEPHKTLNSVKGVITCSDLNLVALEEVKEYLKLEGVTDIYRISRKMNGTLQPTNSYVVTLCLASLPERLKIGYYSVPLRPYIPLPTRCYKCFKFTHPTKYCPGDKAICPDCSEDKHEDACKQPMKCVNCKGPHSTLDRTCPRWVLEKKVTEMKIVEKLSYVDAKRKVISSQVEQARTYASLTRQPKPTKEQAIQCDLPPVKPVSPVKASIEKATPTPSSPIDSNKPSAVLESTKQTLTTTSLSPSNIVIETKSDPSIKSEAKANKKETKHNQKNKSLSKYEPKKPLTREDFLINTQEEKRMMWVDDWSAWASEASGAEEGTKTSSPRGSSPNSLGSGSTSKKKRKAKKN